MYYGLEKENIVFDLSIAQITAILLGGVVLYVIMRWKGMKINPILFFIIYLFPTSGLYIDVGFHLFYHRILLILLLMLFPLMRLMQPADGRRIPFNATTISAIFFLIACLPGLAVCISYPHFFRWWFAILASILFYIVILDEIRNQQQLENFIFTCILSGFVWSAVGLCMFFVVNISIQATDIRQIYRLAGLAKDANFFASVLIGWIQLAFFWILRKKGRYKIIGAFALLTMCTAFIFTYSRGGYLSLVVISLINITLFVRYRKKCLNVIDLKKLLAVAVVFICIFIGSLTMVGSVLERTMSFKTDKSGAGRLYVWTDAIMVTIRNPMGVGLNNYEIYTKKHARDYKAAGSSVHNVFLQIMAETGIVGIVSYMVFVATIILKFKYIKVIRDEQLSFWLTGTLVSYIGIMISSMFITNVYYEHVFLAIALIMGSFQIFKQQHAEIRS